MVHKVRSVVLQVKKVGKKYEIVSGKDAEVFDTEQACQSALNQIVTQWKAYGIQRLVVVIDNEAWAYKRNADGSYLVVQVPVPRRKRKKKTTASEATAPKSGKKATAPKSGKKATAKSGKKATAPKSSKKATAKSGKKATARVPRGRRTAKTIVPMLPSPSAALRKRGGAAAGVRP